MLHHVSVGVADVERAAKFYDAVLGALGFKRTAQYLPYAIAYGPTGMSQFWIGLPHNREAAKSGNGAHIGFSARNKNAVHKFHTAALANGGMDDGAPGPRPDYGPDYYGAFVFDLDGNKVEATVFAESQPAKAKAAPKPKAKAKKASTKAKKSNAKPAKRKAKKR